MARTRVRIRFRKQDDLRFLGHHDLVRVWERLFRRSGIRPAMSEGFHKRPRMNFPSALAVGIAGANEVVELELEQDRESHDIISSLNACAPPGLTVESVERLPEGTRFSQPASAVYEVPLPADRCDTVRQEIERRRNATSGPHTAAVANCDDASTEVPDASPAVTVQGSEKVSGTVAETARRVLGTTVPDTFSDPQCERLPDSVQVLDVVEGVLRMELRLGEAGAVRPRELLATLGLADLESAGAQLVRTRVEVAL